MLNNVTIMGRLTKDVDLRYTNNQTPVASITIACERDTQDKTTDFVDVVSWRGTAEFISKYFHKGDMIIVKGRIQVRDWEDKDGNKRRNTEVVAESVYFGGSKKQTETEDKQIEMFESNEEGLPF